MSATATIPSTPINLKEILAAPDWQQRLLDAFPGCDPTAWTKARQNVLQGKPKRRPRTRQNTSKTNQVLAQNRALAEAVTRVNEHQTLLELALEQVNSKQQWHNGESVTIWQSGKREAWLKNENGLLALTLFCEGRKLTERKYSKPLLVGYLKPDSGWRVSESLEADYKVWKQAAKQAVA